MRCLSLLNCLMSDRYISGFFGNDDTQSVRTFRQSECRSVTQPMVPYFAVLEDRGK